MKYVYVKTNGIVRELIFNGNPDNEEIERLVAREFAGYGGYAVSDNEIPYNGYVEKLDVENNAVIKVSLIGDTLLEGSKSAKKEAIIAYDKSNAVNSFKLNGHAIWLERDIRSEFRMSLDAYKASNLTEIELTLPDLHLSKTIPVELGFALLNQLDVYCAKCNIQTKKHLMAVAALTTPEAVTAYDHTANYPEKLTFNIP